MGLSRYLSYHLALAVVAVFSALLSLVAYVFGYILQSPVELIGGLIMLFVGVGSTLLFGMIAGSRERFGHAALVVSAVLTMMSAIQAVHAKHLRSVVEDVSAGGMSDGFMTSAAGIAPPHVDLWFVLAFAGFNLPFGVVFATQGYDVRRLAKWYLLLLAGYVVVSFGLVRII